MRRNVRNNDEEKPKKNRRFNILDIICLVIIVALIAVYAPRAYRLYSERQDKLSEAKKDEVIEYPLEVKLTEEDTKFFTQFFKDYAVGITSGVDFTDDITEKEMVDFSRAVLSEKYSSSGVISKTSMDSTIKKYFDVSDLDYKKLGYKSLAVYKEYTPKEIYNITKLMQKEKDGDIYLAYVDTLDKEVAKEGTYKPEEVKAKYIFTFKKIENKEEEKNISEVKYIVQKVEKEQVTQSVEEGT